LPPLPPQSLLARISLDVSLLSCPGLLLGLRHDLAIVLNAVLYGVFAYRELRKR